MNRILIALLMALPLATPAGAGCREDIQAMLAQGETWQNYRIETTTLMGGTPVQHTQQWFRDYSHFRQSVRETGVHVLVLGSEEYTSRDGKTWQRSRMRPENWLEETLARNASLRETIRDTACDTETIDGVSHLRFAHTQETVEPLKSVSQVVTLLDPETMRPVQRHLKTTTPAQTVDFGGTPSEIMESRIEMTVKYFWDETVVLPEP
ncbi:hypothetical protein AB2N04_17470 [Nitratireductor sp. GISD-1A_MAKvit]|uniref:hypothetical protein n=1 Tax=Nitratireductor sp. GISD-1A_MAKvit TaxID=3234198 RepID=UPI0034670AE7